MEYLRIEINSNNDVWRLIDKSLEYNLLLNFRPNEILEWWKTDIHLKQGKILKGITVRDLQFDLITDLKGLKELLQLNVHQFEIYQFNKPVSDTFRIQSLPGDNKEKILQDNGLVHIFDCRFEILQISSMDTKFIAKIKNH